MSIRVELVSGRGQEFWPRPGRLFAASPRHSLLLLAGAIDDAFSRWDRQRDFRFWLSDGTRAGDPDPMSAEDEDMEPAAYVKLARLLGRGEQFVYEFDPDDRWLHLCVVGPERIDPGRAFRGVPDRPTAYLGWGLLPDQHGRGWDSDDGVAQPPANPHGRDLPDIGPWRHTS